MKYNCSPFAASSIAVVTLFCSTLLFQLGTAQAQDGPPGMPWENNPPTITSIDYYAVAPNTFMVGGMVQDENPGTCVIQFSNLVNQQIAVDGNGSFAGAITIPHPGLIVAQAIDGSGQKSATEQRYLY